MHLWGWNFNFKQKECFQHKQILELDENRSKAKVYKMEWISAIKEDRGDGGITQTDITDWY